MVNYKSSIFDTANDILGSDIDALIAEEERQKQLASGPQPPGAKTTLEQRELRGPGRPDPGPPKDRDFFFQVEEPQFVQNRAGETRRFEDRANAYDLMNSGLRQMQAAGEGAYNDMQQVAYELQDIFSGDDADAKRNYRRQEVIERMARLDDLGNELPDNLEQAFRGSIRSLMLTVPGGIAGGMTGNPIAGFAGAVAGPVLSEGASARREGLEAGLTEGQANAYAARAMGIEGGIAALFSMFGLGGLEKTLATKEVVWRGINNALKVVGIRTAQELPEEILTEVAHGVNSALSEVDTSLIDDPYNTGLQLVEDTTLQTVMTMGLAEGGRQGVNAVLGRRELPPAPEPEFDPDKRLDDQLTMEPLDEYQGQPIDQGDNLDDVNELLANVPSPPEPEVVEESPPEPEEKPKEEPVEKKKPKVTFKKAKIVPTREGVVAVPIEDGRKEQKMRDMRELGQRAASEKSPKTPPDWAEGDLRDSWLAGYADKEFAAPSADSVPEPKPKPKAKKKKDDMPPERRKAHNQLMLGQTVIESLSSLGEGGNDPITEKDLIGWADSQFGGTRAEGAYETGDAYDAMEAAAADYMATREDYGSGDPMQAIEMLKEVESRLPRQNKRSKKKIENQQFSTPLHYAWAAAWAANIGESDVVFEPSAGTGILAAAASTFSPSKIVVNEMEQGRQELLKMTNAGDVTLPFDAELIGKVWPKNQPRPDVIVMNPPFSRNARKSGNKKVIGTDLKHIEAAMEVLQDGGRLVAIVGAPLKGGQGNTQTFDRFMKRMKEQHHVRAQVRMSRDIYKNMGTNFPTQMLVIDKVSGAKESFISFDADLNTDGFFKLLEDVRNERSAPGKQSSTGSTDETGDSTGARERTGDRTGDVVSAKPDDGGAVSGDTGRTIERDLPETEPESAEGTGEPSGRSGDGGKPGRTGDVDTTKSGGKSGSGQLRTPDKKKRSLSNLSKEKQERAEELKKKIRAKMSRLTSGIDPTIFADAVELGTLYLESGVRRFADWSGEMVEALGDEVKPALKQIYLGTMGTPGAGNYLAEMDSPNDVIAMTDSDIDSMLAKKGSTEIEDTATPAKKEPVQKKAEDKPEEKPIEPEIVDDAPIVQKEREKKTELSQNTYEPYVAQKLNEPNAQPHRALLVESAAMASTSAPDISYRNSLPQSLIKSGQISEAQLESIVYAGQAHEQMIDTPLGKKRRAFLNADGTGLGKTRELLGVIFDNYLKGRKKAVFVTVNKDLKGQLIKDYDAMNNAGNMAGIKGKDAVVNHDSTKVKKGNFDKGIIYTTYGSLSSTKGSRNIEAIVNAVGKDFDGALIFDEAHKLKSTNDTGGDGGFKKEASKVGRMAQKLRDELPNARIVYASATAATEIDDYGYADRLGLWGSGTQFSNVKNFVNSVSAGGIAAMEALARDLKAMGLMVARRISFNDGTPEGTVEFDRVVHNLSDPQKKNYNEIARLWQQVASSVEEAFVESAANKKAQTAKRNQFWSFQQRFFRQIITSMQLPTMIADMEKQLEEGRSVVVQFVNTYDAQLKRGLDSVDLDDPNFDYDTLDMSPVLQLANLVEDHFPVEMYETIVDENGNEQSVMVRQPAVDDSGNPVLDNNGNPMTVPVQDPALLAKREKLIEQIKKHKAPDSPLDFLVNHFGHTKVAEITTREARIVEDEDGNKKKQKRNKKMGLAELEDFKDDKLQVVLFSDAGGTGVDYHADRNIKNQRRRVHYILDPGFKSENAMQGLGRTHRTNQSSAPIYKLVTTDLPSQMRFISTIARRLGQLGALSMGQRDAGSGGIFSENDNMESIEAQEAYRKMLLDISRDLVVGIRKEELEKQTGLSFDPQEGTGGAPSVNVPFNRFLNRMLSLEVDLQGRLFEEFSERWAAQIEFAIENDMLDKGIGIMEGESFKKVDDQVVRKDENTGAETRFLKIEVQEKTNPLSWESIQKLKPVGYVRNKTSGKVWANIGEKTETDAKTGSVSYVYRLKSVTGTVQKVAKDQVDMDGRMARWESVENAQEAWTEQFEEVPDTKTRNEYMVAGLLLPVWNDLGKSNQVERLITNQGEEILGKRIAPMDLEDVKHRLGVKTVEGESLPDAKEAATGIVKGKYKKAKLSDDVVVERRKVGGEWRIEVRQGKADQGTKDAWVRAGMFGEVIGGIDRYFAPTGEAEKILHNLFGNSIVQSVETAKRTAEQIAQESDAGPELEQTHGGIGFLNPFGRRQPARPDAIPDEAKVPNPEVEAAFQQSFGMKSRTWRDWSREVWGEAFNMATRAEQYIPNDAKWGAAHEWFRLLKEVANFSGVLASRRVASVIDPLGPKLQQVFGRYLIVQNMLEGKLHLEPRRFNFESWQEVEEYAAQLQEIVDKTPSLQEAIKRREEIISELQDDLVYYDLLPEGIKDRKAYYHQQVLHHAVLGTGSGSKAKKTKRGFQKQRVKGVEELKGLDYNTNYIEAETTWMTEALIEIEKEKRLRILEKAFDTKPRLKQKARRRNIVNSYKDTKTYEKAMLLREEKKDMEPESKEKAEQWLVRNDPFYLIDQEIAKSIGMFQHGMEKRRPAGMNISGKLEIMLKKDALDEMDETVMIPVMNWAAKAFPDSYPAIAAKTYFKSIREKTEIMQKSSGDKFVTWEDLARDVEGYSMWFPKPGNVFYQALSIPEKLAEQLEKDGVDMIPVSKDDLRKVMVMGGRNKVLFLPTEIVEQLDSMDKPKPDGVSWGLYLDTIRGWKVWTLFNPTSAPGYTLRNITGDLDPIVATDHRILEYSVKAIQDLYDFHRGNLHMIPSIRSAIKNGVISSGLTAIEVPELKQLEVFKRFYSGESKGVVGKYFEVIKDFNEFRENIFRYAAFLYYLDNLHKVEHYGGSRKAVVMDIARVFGKDAAAAHMARNLLGDYGNLTVMGDWLRTRAIPYWSWQEINIKRYPLLLHNALQVGGGTMRGKAKAVGKVVAGRAIRSVGVNAVRLLAVMKIAAGYAAISAFNHLIFPDEEEELGEFDKANPHIIYGRLEDGNIGVLRNVGALGDMLEWFGLNTLMSLWPQVEAGQITIDDLAWEMADDPAQKIGQGLSPFIKGPFELATGQSYFPDIFNPRTQPRDEIAAGVMGMVDEYRGLKGVIFKDGSRMRPNYLARLLGVSDPRKNAYYEIIGLREKYLKKKGAPQGNYGGISRYRTIKEAAFNDDFDAFREARQAFIRDGGDFQKFQKWLGHLDPIAQRLKDEDEVEFESDFLTDLQREKLKVARDSAREMEIQLWRWWQEASAKDDTPEQRREFDAAFDRAISSKVWSLGSEKPEESSEALGWLSERGITDKEDLRRLMRETAERRKYRTQIFDGKRLTSFGKRMMRLNRMNLN